MFGFKRNVTKELNKIWTEIYKHQRKLDNAYLERKSIETQLEIVKDEIKEIEINYGDTIHNHDVFIEKTKKAIPTFNKMIEKVNHLNGLTKVMEKILIEMDKKIKRLENKPVKENKNKGK